MQDQMFQPAAADKLIATGANFVVKDFDSRRPMSVDASCFSRRSLAHSVMALACFMLCSSAQASAPQSCLNLFQQKMIEQHQGEFPSLQSRSLFTLERFKNWLRLRQNDFTVNRNLLWSAAKASYESDLGSEFITDLKGLGSSQRWVDVGAGDGSAVLDFSQSPDFGAEARAVEVVGIGVVLPKQNKVEQIRKLNPSFRYISGKKVEDLKPADIGGLADVVSDGTSAIHYSENLSQVLTSEIEFLKVGGRFYTSYPLSTRILQKGRSISLDEFLRQVPGLEVYSLSSAGAATPAILVIKTLPHVSIPQLELIDFKADTPPRRLFQTLDP